MKFRATFLLAIVTSPLVIDSTICDAASDDYTTSVQNFSTGAANDSQNGSFTASPPDGYKICTFDVKRTNSNPNRDSVYKSVLQNGSVTVSYNLPFEGSIILGVKDGWRSWFDCTVTLHVARVGLPCN